MAAWHWNVCRSQKCHLGIKTLTKYVFAVQRLFGNLNVSLTLTLSVGPYCVKPDTKVIGIKMVARKNGCYLDIEICGYHFFLEHVNILWMQYFSTLKWLNRTICFRIPQSLKSLKTGNYCHNFCFRIFNNSWMNVFSVLHA